MTRGATWLGSLAVLSITLWAHIAAAGVYLHVRVEGTINPIKARYLKQAVEQAVSQGAELVIVSIDTPGGLVSSMQDMTSTITNAPLPVVAWVEPFAAQATSAGAFLLLAADVAAMAPGTRVGAAHPIGGDKALEGPIDAKATNSLVALAKSLAARRDRPTSIAEAMVRESTSLTAAEAKEAHVVEVLAESRGALLTALDGRVVEKADRRMTLSTAGLSAVEFPMSPASRLLDVAADPTIASLLVTLGALGIAYELAAPGIGAGGILGLILLLLGLSALSTLPIRLAGVLLLVTGLTAIAVEIKVQTHGVLAAFGALSLVLGAVVLVDESRYLGAAQHVELPVFAPLGAAMLAGFLIALRLTSRALRAPFYVGVTAMRGARGTVKEAFTRTGAGFEGWVFVDGARWEATADEGIAEGERITVEQVSMHPMRLRVRRTGRENADGNTD